MSVNTTESIEVPLVSVCVQTYCHGPYIADCLDGILAQKTDFQIEVIVGEDDSTDDTRQICQDYAARNPEIRNAYKLFRSWK